MEVVVAFFDFLQFLADWFTGQGPDGGIFGWWQSAVEWVIAELFMLWLKSKIWVLTTAWSAAKLVLENLGINGLLSGAWGSLPDDIRVTLQYFNIPQAVNLIITAFTSKLILRVVM